MTTNTYFMNLVYMLHVKNRNVCWFTSFCTSTSKISITFRRRHFIKGDNLMGRKLHNKKLNLHVRKNNSRFLMYRILNSLGNFMYELLKTYCSKTNFANRIEKETARLLFSTIADASLSKIKQIFKDLVLLTILWKSSW